ncbi:phosphatidylinositol 4-phosphate 5-kinase 5-like [Gastrolobium bilobum]|uniref:phosphatidylinositol 4-phosphate 5-kinase 5-like n=1 Tax=Gastrolobium bilobum TaxID=150636 RepID=UPI002AB047B6|nr:phosphatidylinositol 4-phosphate 5-kinase 5-like [Gastrolobium bilobum]
METQRSQAKLTRTHSSLLRSSPTIRSSIQSLSSINEEELVAAQHQQSDDDDDKNKKPYRSSFSYTPIRTGSTRITTPVVLAVASLGFFGACSLFLYLFYFFYLGNDDVPTSENLLLALIFIAVALYFASKNKGLIHRALSLVKHSWDENVKRVGFCKAPSKPVQWFIGDSGGATTTTTVTAKEKKKKIIREGVEFYSNGDFYEGEFHKGRSNGSGVYNYFVNGRYEGDWVDGKYDGYGIESWTRGSRYRGQYRQGLRHGYGVYRFYTGDSYAGEWCNGQSHGMGLQTCSDASCYIGQFKYGVKHGIGCYHFRNGDRYAGEYFGDKIHGFGVYHFANGHCYEGAWHEGRRQGIGTYTFRNGDRRCGEWDAGNLKHPLPPLTDVVLRAVQAARKTAENAINLRRMDDHVNNAVIAANKAATAARVAAVKAVQNRMDGKFCDTDV